MNKHEPIIKPTKKFCRDRVFLRHQDRSLYVAEQKLLDFLLWNSIKYQSNIIQFSPNDYFTFCGYDNPSGKQYRNFYMMLKVLFNTCIFWDLENCGAVSHLLDDLIFNCNNNDRKRNTSIQVELHQSLIQVLTWQRSNVILNLDMTMKLKCEYSYFLFIFLLVDYIGDGNEHTYNIGKLRKDLNASEEQSDTTFKILFRRAVKEISEKTFLNLSFKIRGQSFRIRNLEKITNSNVSEKSSVKYEKDVLEERLKRLEIMFSELQNNPIFREKEI